jgi:hypothetical protein
MTFGIKPYETLFYGKAVRPGGQSFTLYAPGIKSNWDHGASKVVPGWGTIQHSR